MKKEDQIAFNAAIARGIKARRKALGMTQQILANKTGLTQPYIHSLETGIVKVPLYTLVDLSKAMECSIDTLMGNPGHVDALHKAIDDLTPERKEVFIALIEIMQEKGLTFANTNV